jgi:RNA recognition motif-containing protein
LIKIIIVNIFVGNISDRTTEDEIWSLFDPFGVVYSINVAYDKYSGRGKGFAFVEMPDDSNAVQAIKELNNSVVAGQTIVVYEARPKPERPENNRFSRSGPRPGFRPRY